MKLNLKLSQKVLVLVCMPVFFQIVFVAILLVTLNRRDQEVAKVRHVNNILMTTDSALKDFYDFATSVAAYKTTRNEMFFARFEALSKGLPLKLKSLGKLVANDKAKREQVVRLEKIWQRAGTIIEDSKNAVEGGGSALSFMHLLNQHRELQDIVEGMISELEALQKAYPHREADEVENRYQNLLQQSLILGVAFNVALVLVLLKYFNRSTTERLNRLIENTVNLSSGKPLAKAIGGTDEIARLDYVFHQMADTIDEATRRERTILENATDVICSLDAKATFTAVNPACERLWGYEPDDLLGRKLISMVAPDERERARTVFEQAKEAGFTDFELRFQLKDGEQADTSWSAQWAEGEQLYFCVVHDITARKEMERLKQEFVQMVSHDLRTPMTSLSVFLSMITSGVYGDVPEGLARAARINENGITRLIGLINDLLDIEKMASGKLQLFMQAESVSDLISRSIDSVQGFAEVQEVKLKSSTQKNLEVVADGDRIVQVLVNLLSNAIKFSESVRLVEISSQSDGEQVEIRVRDWGCGIPEEQQEAIFERFHQVSADKHKHKGTGLGLPICRAIIEAHGGTIGVSSTPGNGSAFYFRLPLSRSASADAPNDQTDSPD